MSAVTTPRPMLTLGKGTRINCKSARKATELVAALAAIGVPARLVRPVGHELPAVVLEAGAEVHFEPTPGGAPAPAKSRK